MWEAATDWVAGAFSAVSGKGRSTVGVVARRVLVIQCHPAKASFNAALSESVCKGLLSAGHEVRLRRLYCYEDDKVSFAVEAPLKFSVDSYGATARACIQPYLSLTEKEKYHDPESTSSRELDRENMADVPPDVRNAVRDLLWCDSIVFVYPTWWFNFPAVLKGYFDRVFLPGIAFQVPQPGVPAPVVGGTGLIPKLTHINKVGVVTTFGASWPVVVFAGDNGRRFVSRGFRALCAPSCGMMWHGLYESTVCDDAKRQKFLEEVERDYSSF